eukprot:2136007-Alexandrium_andersonii.AAC.1
MASKPANPEGSAFGFPESSNSSGHAPTAASIVAKPQISSSLSSLDRDSLLPEPPGQSSSKT